MHGDEVVAAEKEIDVARGKVLLSFRQIHSVQHEVQVPGIGLDFRVLQRTPRIVYGQWVKPEDVAQDSEVIFRWCGKIYPQCDDRRGIKPSRLDRFDDSGDAVAVGVDGNHGRSHFRVLTSRFVFRFGAGFTEARTALRFPARSPPALQPGARRARGTASSSHSPAVPSRKTESTRDPRRARRKSRA